MSSKIIKKTLEEAAHIGKILISSSRRIKKLKVKGAVIYNLKNNSPPPPPPGEEIFVTIWGIKKFDVKWLVFHPFSNFIQTNLIIFSWIK